MDKRIPEQHIIQPDWPAPDNIEALCTTRASFSPSADMLPPEAYEHFNLALHVGDTASSVQTHRRQLASYLGVQEANIAWLEQVHGTRVVDATEVCATLSASPEKADASFTRTPTVACTVMTADCLPVLFCNLPDQGEMQYVAAAHAGWKGLAAGILSDTLSRFPQPNNVIAWLGPAIGQAHFEVGQDVYDAFVLKDAGNAEAFLFNHNASQQAPKWHASLYQLARRELLAAGIKGVYGGNWCTYKDKQWFYSFRRDGSKSGRMASLIMIR